MSSSYYLESESTGGTLLCCETVVDIVNIVLADL